MRTLTVFTASLVLVLGLSFSAAKADPTVTLTWTSSALGATGLGTGSVQVQAGDTLTLSVDWVSATEVSGFATTYQWTPGVINHALSVLDPNNGWQVTGNGAVNNPGGSAVAQLAGSFVFGVGPSGSIHQGDITFVAGASGSTSVVTGVFTGFDGITGPGGVPYTNVTFNNASINIVPEPGTAALLALGLGALTIAGRRRKA